MVVLIESRGGDSLSTEDTFEEHYLFIKDILLRSLRRVLQPLYRGHLQSREVVQGGLEMSFRERLSSPQKPHLCPKSVP